MALHVSIWSAFIAAAAIIVASILYNLLVAKDEVGERDG